MCVEHRIERTAHDWPAARADSVPRARPRPGTTSCTSTATCGAKSSPILYTHYRCIAVDGPLGHTPTRWQQLQPPIADLIADAIAFGLSDLTVVANNTGIAYTQVFVAIHPDKLAGLVLTPGDVVWNFLPLPIKWMRPTQQPTPRRDHRHRLLLEPRLGRSVMPDATGKNPAGQAVLDSRFQPATRRPELRCNVVKLLRAARPRAAITAARHLLRFTGPILIAWERPQGHACLLLKLLADPQIRLNPAHTSTHLERTTREGPFCTRYQPR